MIANLPVQKFHKKFKQKKIYSKILKKAHFFVINDKNL
jgi:hypothetical protein